MECELSLLQKLEKGELLSLEEIMGLLKRVKPIFDAEPNIIDITGPVTVVSDIHGQFFELLEIFKIGGDLPEHQYLFLGDVVDRGSHSVESLVYLLALKEMYPHRITILRGQDESASVTQVNGFYDEVMEKYQNNINLFDAFCSIFDCLPLCAIVDKKACCLHGGITPDINTIDGILAINRKQDVLVDQAMRELVYAIPHEDMEGFQRAPRHPGYFFGSNVLNQFLKDNDLELMIQSNYCQNGAEFIFDGKLLKLFSATNYIYRCENRGAIVLLYLDEDGSLQKKISFVPQSQKTIEFLAQRESAKKASFANFFNFAEYLQNKKSDDE